MRYDEYLLCAEKHLKGCMQLLTYQQGTMHDCQVWLELYYLSGYIIEGLVIYSAYKIYNWRPSDDIQKKYNLSFSQQTNLDFYRARSWKVNGIEKIPSFFQNRPIGAMSVQGHRFQDIAKTLLKPNPSFIGVPYIGDGVIDPDIEKLIDDWRPEVRYHYNGMQLAMPTLNNNVITRLLSTCSMIYIKHI